MVIASIAAIVWWAAAPGTLVSDVAFAAVLIGGITTVLMNVNPLIPLDGYYALSDWLEVPNLRQRAFAHLSWLIKTRLFGLDLPQPPADEREQRIFLIYGALAAAYIVAHPLVLRRHRLRLAHPVAGVARAWSSSWPALFLTLREPLRAGLRTVRLACGSARRLGGRDRWRTRLGVAGSRRRRPRRDSCPGRSRSPVRSSAAPVLSMPLVAPTAGSSKGTGAGGHPGRRRGSPGPDPEPRARAGADREPESRRLPGGARGSGTGPEPLAGCCRSSTRSGPARRRDWPASAAGGVAADPGAGRRHRRHPAARGAGRAAGWRAATPCSSWASRSVEVRIALAGSRSHPDPPGVPRSPAAGCHPGSAR